MKRINLSLDAALDIIFSSETTKRAWIEDQHFRRVFTPCNCVLELQNADMWFSGLDYESDFQPHSVAHIVVVNANVVGVRYTNDKGESKSVAFTREENHEFMLDLFKGLESHGFRLTWFTNRQSPDQEVTGILVDKR